MMKSMIVFGLILIVAGLLWPWLSKIGLGHLPGDIIIKRNNIHIYFPITTCIIISLIISIIWWLLR